MSASELQPLIEAAYADRSLLAKDEYKAAVLQVLADLDQGKFRVATQDAPGKWTTHAWLKQAVLLYFGIAKMERMEVGPFEFYDKIPLKKNLDKAGVRVVPPGTIRYGAFVESGAIVMPGYV
ncbi:MAG TPA: 2,3,4,5-tetrahydropyridine-2,6-dicarboxylate N-succinyltransferase, partial [Polyangiaceae bacterium]